MKQAVKEKIDPVPALYQQQLQEISARENLEEMATQLPTLYSMKCSLYQLRKKRLPPFPTSRNEVHFEGEWTQTIAGEPFLLAEDGDEDDKIIIFQLMLTSDISQRLTRSMLTALFRHVPDYFIRSLWYMLS